MRIEQDKDIPLVSQSREKLAEDAPKAIAYLNRIGHIEDAEVLGLAEYVQKAEESG